MHSNSHKRPANLNLLIKREHQMFWIVQNYIHYDQIIVRNHSYLFHLCAFPLTRYTVEYNMGSFIK